MHAWKIDKTSFCQTQRCLPCARKTRSSGSCDADTPAAFRSSTKGSFRLGGATALKFRVGQRNTHTHTCRITHTITQHKSQTHSCLKHTPLTVAGDLCCKLAPNVPSNQSFRLGRISPLNRYLKPANTLHESSACKLTLHRSLNLHSSIQNM